MGFTPRQIDQCDFWEFAAMWKGWRKANGADTGPRAPTDEEFDRLVALSDTLH